MKKHAFLILMPLFFMDADVQAQDECGEESSCYEESCIFDQTDFYAKIFGGTNFVQNSTESGNKAKYNAGYVISGSLGYCWSNGLCVEGEYAYRRNTLSKIDFVVEGFSRNGHFQTSSYMANLLWDLPLSAWDWAAGWNLRSFIGAGIGYDVQRMHASNSRIIFDQKWHHFSWQFMAGLAYPIFCHTKLTVEYRFHRSSSHFYNHAVGIGFLYKFGNFR